MKSTHNMYFDGGKKANNISYGYVIYDQDKQELYKNSGKFSHAIISSNAAEYLGLIFGMVEALKLGIKNIVIYGDNQVIINQINGQYKAKSPILLTLRIICKEMMKKFDEIEIVWIPREHNRDAHRMCK
jgi:ribonuclease HI